MSKDNSRVVKYSDGTEVRTVKKELPAGTDLFDMMKMPGCIINLMPAIAFNNQTGKFEFPVECTQGGQHPHAYWSCLAKDFKENESVRQEWESKQKELIALFWKRENEAMALKKAGVDLKKLRNV